MEVRPHLLLHAAFSEARKPWNCGPTVVPAAGVSPPTEHRAVGVATEVIADILGTSKPRVFNLAPEL